MCPAEVAFQLSGRMSLEAKIEWLKKEIERESEERRRLEIEIREKEEVGAWRMASIMEEVGAWRMGRIRGPWEVARKGRGA